MSEPLEVGLTEIPLTPENVSVEFRVRWLGVIVVRGRFADVRGSLSIPDGDIARVSVDVAVALASVDTRIALRDRHLRGPHFLDVERYPVATFRGGSIMRCSTSVALPGSLTLRGVTQTEELSCAIEDADLRLPTVIVRAWVMVERESFGVGVVRGRRAIDPLFALISEDVRVDVSVRIPRELVRRV